MPKTSFKKNYKNVNTKISKKGAVNIFTKKKKKPNFKKNNSNR